MKSGPVRAALAIVGAAIVVAVPAERPVRPAAPGCSVSSISALNFGAYDPFRTTPTDGAGSIKYQCTGNPSVMLSLSGVTASGMREMVSATDRLSYNVYVDAARVVVFGDDTNGGSSVLIGTIKNSGQQTTVFYGRIPAGQDVAAGDFVATLVATINF